MQFQFSVQNFKLSDEQRAYAEEKIQRISKLAPRIDDPSTLVRVDFKLTRFPEDEKRFSCEVTLNVPGSVIRAECYAASVEAAVDSVEEKLRKQFERYKAKLHRRGKAGEWLPTSTLEAMEDEHTEAESVKITKRKRYDSTRKPMTEEEAIEQMELLGHGFFLFENADTGRFSVVYRRYMGDYGIIEPLKEGEQKEE